MTKTIRKSHVVGEAGVVKFAEYCNNHTPYIIFREVVKNDFGIDAEIELTRTNEDGKIEATGEIIKVQIKSTDSDKSYIQKETDKQFEFHPRKEDLEYWSKYINNGIDVLLVVYDHRSTRLFCKKVGSLDMYIAKQKTQKKQRNINSIIFDKTENLLEIGESSFTKKFSNSFKNRVDYDVKETLVTNFLKLKQFPKLIYKYGSQFKSKKEVYEHITDDDAPYFILYGGFVFTFIDLGKEYSVFKDKVLDGSKSIISYSEILDNASLKRHYTELINEHLKPFFRNQRLVFSKQYKRYFFHNYENKEEVRVSVTTRKRGSYSEKPVVKYYEYGKMKFYKHIAIEVNYEFFGAEIYLIVNPKYIFTEDGKTTLAPKQITKLTNYLTAREFNNHYCDWLHFWWSYLSKGNNEIVIYEDPIYRSSTKDVSKLYPKHLRISTHNFSEFPVDFGIHTDKKNQKKEPENPLVVTQTLF